MDDTTRCEALPRPRGRLSRERRMEFRERLNTYIDLLGCTSSELAEAAGLSVATVSRYRSGERVPQSRGSQVRALAGGIASLSAQRGDEPVLNEPDVLVRLQEAASGGAADYDLFRSNLGTLLATLEISNSELARSLSYDPSYISRIISGSRRPADLPKFVQQVAGVVGRRCGNPAHAGEIASLVGCSAEQVSTPESCAVLVGAWLTSDDSATESPLGRFLRTVDAFDLGEYVRSIHYDELRVPTAPFQLPTTRTYSGIREIIEAELDFLRATVLSRSQAPVFIYSNMPLDEMTEDPDFPKKWAFGVAMMLKKGLRINMVHDVDRPLPEMLVGLEGWVPMYMTGQISPFYLPEPQSGVFRYNLKVSGAAALEGQAVVGHHAEGRYVVTKSKDELRGYALRAKRLLEHARPLMRIYRETDADAFAQFLDGVQEGGRWRAILSTPPIQTISPELLQRVLDDNGIAGDARGRIMAYAARRHSELERLIGRGQLVVELGVLSEDEFERTPASLSLAALFCSSDVTYTYAQYLEHVELTREFVETHEGCELRTERAMPFRSTQVFIDEGRWVLVSKAKAPTIHFVIEHPRMVEAFECFVPIA